MKATKMMAGVEVLEEKHMISTLMFLFKNGQSRKIDIYAGVSTNPRMPDKIDTLEEVGLVRQRKEPFSRATVVALTPAGEQVANMLAAIDRCMGEQRPRD